MIKIKGVEELKRKLREIGADAGEGMGAALYEEGEAIMTRSKSEFVPVDTGTLRSTGTVSQPEINGKRVEVTLGYGGPSTPYALAQHERTDYTHKVGQAKYLERPFLEAVRGMGNRLAERMRRWLERQA